MRRGLFALFALVLVYLMVWALTPRPKIDRQISFDASVLGNDPEVWLQVSEQQYSDIRPGAAKRILWAGAKGQKTPLAVIYVHGFTASAEEIRPVPDEVAQALGANLYYTRLTGQGRAPEAMTSARPEDWLADMAEAIAIGRAIGDRVIVIGTAMGGALTALAASDPELSQTMAGVVLISPAFALRQPMDTALTMPFARAWLPLLTGRMQHVAVLNADHERYWAVDYPTSALFALSVLMREAKAQDYAAAKMPLLVLQSPEDQQVDPDATAEALGSWGGPVEFSERRMQAGDDPRAHIIAGDVFSPGQTEDVVALIMAWTNAWVVAK